MSRRTLSFPVRFWALGCAGLCAGTMTPVVAASASVAVNHSRSLASCTPSFQTTAQQTLTPEHNGGGLTSVAVADQNHAYAVGTAYNQPFDGDKSDFTGLLDVGIGTNWTLKSSVAGTSLSGDDMTSVAASDNRNVWVVGYTAENQLVPVILHKSKSWQAVTISAANNFAPTAVVTRSPSDVYVGGDRLTNQGTPQILHFNGNRWSTTTFFSLPNYTLADLALIGNRDVVAVANQVTDTGEENSAVEFFNGHKWVAIPFTTDTLLQQISGSSRHDLWATAISNNPDYHDQTVYHHAASWTSQTIDGQHVFGVSDRNSHDVWFAGGSMEGGVHGENFDGSQFDDVSYGKVSGEYSEIRDIDAQSADQIVAVGSSTDAVDPATDETDNQSTVVEQTSC